MGARSLPDERGNCPNSNIKPVSLQGRREKRLNGVAQGKQSPSPPSIDAIKETRVEWNETAKKFGNGQVSSVNEMNNMPGKAILERFQSKKKDTEIA